MSQVTKLGVARVRGDFRALAAQPIGDGETVILIDGVATRQPTRYTLQVEENVHIAPPSGLSLEPMIDRFPWQFMNHSCDPNVAVRGRSVIALRPIAVHEEVTFDYRTTEYDMAEPFLCACGSPRCRRETIRGFKHTSPAERERLLPLVAEFLLRRLEAEVQSA